MEPHRLLLRHPGETLPWLRRQLRLNQRAFAERIAGDAKSVSNRETGRTRVSLPYHRRIVPLLVPHLHTAEGRARLATLARASRPPPPPGATGALAGVWRAASAPEGVQGFWARVRRVFGGE